MRLLLTCKFLSSINVKKNSKIHKLYSKDGHRFQVEKVRVVFFLLASRGHLN